LLKDYFQKKNYEVVVRHNLPVHYLDVISEERPDVIFLDNNLPEGMGWHIAPAIAEHFTELHLVLVSAFHPQIPSMPAQAIYTVIEKPIKLAELNLHFPDNALATNLPDNVTEAI
jgi:two-component SAPR family response regulator